MATVVFLVCITLCLRSGDTDGFVDADLKELFADEGWQSLGIVLKTWSGLVGCAEAGIVQGILSVC